MTMIRHLTQKAYDDNLTALNELKDYGHAMIMLNDKNHAWTYDIICYPDILRMTNNVICLTFNYNKEEYQIHFHKDEMWRLEIE